jgi:hypothetical protein
MKILVSAFASCLILAGAGVARAQTPSALDNISFFGPRAGISVIPETLLEDKSTQMVNSLFGWSMDIRYMAKGNFEGFAEAGFFLEGVENGVIYPEAWGYFGFRQKQGWGIALGPQVSVYGVGLGIAPSYSFRVDRLLIPVTLNTVITGGEPRWQLHFGFSHASE